MKNLTQIAPEMLALGRFFSLRPTKLALMTALVTAAGLVTSLGTNVTLRTSDAATTTSFTGSTNWNPTGVPVAGNTYVSGAFTIRTPNNTTSGVTNIFAGNSLSIDSGGRLLAKVGNNVAANTTWADNSANYILNGGTMDQAGANSDLSVCIIDGTVTVNAPSFLGALGATTSSSSSFETLNIIAPVSGSANLQISGASINTGQDTGIVILSNNNTNYTGTITVTNANGGIVASAPARILCLNNLSAVSNATLNLVATAVNPVGFSNTVNVAAFNVGALSGSSSEALSDTAGSAVSLSVGGKNASTSFNGALTGNGSLTKVGTGTLTLGGNDTYSGNTIINGGTLALAATALLTNSSITVGTGATLDVSSNSFTLTSVQSLFGNGTVKGAVNVGSGAKVYGDAGVVYGTNMFATNVTFLPGGQAIMNLGTVYNGTNDLIVVGGNLALNSTTFTLNTPNSSVNLDQTADYILAKVTGAVSGVPVLVWGITPLNSAHYSIIKSGTNVVLHYNASLAPAGNGSASPNPVVRNQPVVITVTVTFNANPISSVTVDASQLGGSSALALVAAGGGVYTNSVVVASGIPAGVATLVATMTDSASAVGTTAPFTVTVNTASETWSGSGGDNSWSTNPNWQSGYAPGYLGDALTFAGTTRLTPNMNGSYNIASLTFDGSAGSFTLTGNGSVLTLNGGIANNSSNPQMVTVPIANAGNSTDFSGSGNVTVNATISGTGGLQNDDSAVVALGGTNSFTGGISINSGILQISGAGLLGTNGIYTGAISNAGGMFEYSSSATQTLTGVISQFEPVVKDGPGKLILAGANVYTANTYISNGVLQVTGALGSNLGNTYVYSIVDNGTLEWSGVSTQLLSGAISGTGGLQIDGSGTLTLGGANTYTGPTIVTGGTLVPGSASLASLAISGGGTVSIVFNGSSLSVNSLALNTNGILYLNFNNLGGSNPSTAAIAAGTISSSGTNIIHINAYNAVVGQFPLISYTGAPLANLNNIVLILPPGLTANLVNNSQVRWPWGERTSGVAKKPDATDRLPAGQSWRDAATADRVTSSGNAHWVTVDGLGSSGRAMALEPARLASSWKEDDTNAPTLEFDFTSRTGDVTALLNFMPTFRIYPGMRLQVAVGVDERAPMVVEVPGSSGAESENGTVRSAGVQNNYVIARVSLSSLSAGKHTLKIRAVDPGAVIDAVSLP